MTKKDYELIATILKKAKKYLDNTTHCKLSDYQYERICNSFGFYLEKENPQFKYDRFMGLCGNLE